MHEVVHARPTLNRPYALACELAPILAPMLAFGTIALFAYISAPFGDPPEAVLVPVFLLAVGCLLTFGFSGIGWIYVGEARIGATIFIGRLAGLFALYIIFWRAWGAAGTPAQDNYTAPFYVLGAFAVFTPLLSAAALAWKLWRSNGEPRDHPEARR